MCTHETENLGKFGEIRTLAIRKRIKKTLPDYQPGNSSSKLLSRPDIS